MRTESVKQLALTWRFDRHLLAIGGKRIYSARGFRIPSTPIVDDTLPSHDSKILPPSIPFPPTESLDKYFVHDPRGFTGVRIIDR